MSSNTSDQVGSGRWFGSGSISAVGRLHHRQRQIADADVEPAGAIVQPLGSSVTPPPSGLDAAAALTWI